MDEIIECTGRPENREGRRLIQRVCPEDVRPHHEEPDADGEQGEGERHLLLRQSRCLSHGDLVMLAQAGLAESSPGIITREAMTQVCKTQTRFQIYVDGRA